MIKNLLMSNDEGYVRGGNTVVWVLAVVGIVVIVWLVLGALAHH